MNLLKSLAAIFVLAQVNYSIAQNPSDGCGGVPALTVGASCSTTAYTLPGSYTNGGLVDASCRVAGSDRDDGWYSVTATSTGTMTVELLGSRAHTLAIWSACGGGTELGCDQKGSGVTAIVAFAATNGVTYWVQVHRNNNNNNTDMNGTVCAYMGAAGGGGTGVDCLNGVTLTPGTQQCGTNSNGGSFADGGGAPTNPCNSSYNDGEYWYEYTGTGQALQLDVSGLTATYSGLFVLDDCPSGSPNCVASYTSGFSTANFTLTTSALTAGQTYYIVIANWSTPYQTDFCLDATSVAPPVPPLNDDCAGAFACTVNPTAACTSVTSGTVNLATPSPTGTGGCGGTDDDDVWFSFVATGATHYVSLVNIAGSTTDMYHSVWDGCGGGAALVPGTCMDANSQTVSGLTPGNTYYVRVYTWTSTTGQTSTFDVCIGTPPPPPPNDDPCAATPAVVNPDAVCNLTTPGYCVGATQSQAGCVGTADDDVWFSFVALDANQNIEILNATGTTDMVHELFSGPCGSLTSIGCSDPNLSTYTGLVVGNTYYVRVYTYSSSGSNTGFDLCITSPCGLGGGAPTCNLDYAHSTIPYSPVGYNTGANLAFTDDKFAPSYSSIGFPFCFDGILYNDVLVSSNGYLIFPGCYSAAPTATSVTAGGTSAWSIYTDAPNVDDAPRNAIMGPWQDIDPSVSGSIIRTNIHGVAPNRIFVAKFNTVGMFSCTADDFTGQIMLYETTYDIEVHIGEKTICAGWNAGGAIMGLHNWDGTQAVIPAGYNYSTPWSVPTNNQEGHRFTTNCPDCNIPLPVELIDFRGQSEEGYNFIQWKTITEKNNDYFVLERSIGGSQFEAIATIDGNGNSNQEIEYSYRHMNPDKIQYYRLRQVDLDGKTSYSAIISVKSNTGSGISIYPNPTEGKLFFDVESVESSNETITIRYTDITGKTVSEQVNVTNQSMTYELAQFANLDSGIYIVRFTNASGEIITTEKVVKQ